MINNHLTKENVIDFNIGFHKVIIIDEDFLELFFYEEEEEKDGRIRIGLEDMVINLDNNPIPSTLIHDICDRAEDAFADIFHYQLDSLNDQYDLTSFPYRDIETYLMNYITLNHQEHVIPLQTYVTETVNDYILNKALEYLGNQIPNIPKPIQSSKMNDGSYACSFTGYICWDELKEDFFFLNELSADERETARIYIVFKFDHPLEAINYHHQYEDKYRTC